MNLSIVKERSCLIYGGRKGETTNWKCFPHPQCLCHSLSSRTAWFPSMNHTLSHDEWVSKWLSGSSEWMSAAERASKTSSVEPTNGWAVRVNGRASGPVFPYRLLVVLEHGVIRSYLRPLWRLGPDGFPAISCWPLWKCLLSSFQEIASFLPVESPGNENHGGTIDAIASSSLIVSLLFRCFQNIRNDGQILLFRSRVYLMTSLLVGEGETAFKAWQNVLSYLKFFFVGEVTKRHFELICILSS